MSDSTFLPISSFYQLISYNEVCLFSIIKNIVNIYINCTTYIQIHTVLYSKIFLPYCYPVAPCIASWTNYLDTYTEWYWQYKGGKWYSLMTILPVVNYFGAIAHTIVRQWLVGACSRCGWHYRVGSWQSKSSHVTFHSFQEDDASLRTFIRVKIIYNTQDYSKKCFSLARYKVHSITSICGHIGADKEKMFVVTVINHTASAMIYVISICHRDIMGQAVAFMILWCSSGVDTSVHKVPYDMVKADVSYLQ